MKLAGLLVVLAACGAGEMVDEGGAADAGSRPDALVAPDAAVASTCSAEGVGWVDLTGDLDTVAAIPATDTAIFVSLDLDDLAPRVSWAQSRPGFVGPIGHVAVAGDAGWQLVGGNLLSNNQGLVNPTLRGQTVAAQSLDGNLGLRLFLWNGSSWAEPTGGAINEQRAPIEATTAVRMVRETDATLLLYSEVQSGNTGPTRVTLARVTDAGVTSRIRVELPDWAAGEDVKARGLFALPGGRQLVLVQRPGGAQALLCSGDTLSAHPAGVFAGGVSRAVQAVDGSIVVQGLDGAFYRLDGTGWTPVAGPLEAVRFTVDGEGRIVAGVHDGDALVIRRWEGAGWQDLGPPLETCTAPSQRALDMTVDGCGRPLVLSSCKSGEQPLRLTVFRHEGT